MTAYRVNHRYGDRVDNERFDLVAGQVVDLTPGTAERINRNSPGAVSLAESEPEPTKVVELVTPSGPVDVTEHVRGDAEPVVVDESEPPESDPANADEGSESEPTVESAPEAPKRRGRPPKTR